MGGVNFTAQLIGSGLGYLLQLLLQTLLSGLLSADLPAPGVLPWVHGLAVGVVGMRLLLRVGLPQVVPPEWLLLLLVAALFVWGFSVRLPKAPKPLKP